MFVFTRFISHFISERDERVRNSFTILINIFSHVVDGSWRVNLLFASNQCGSLRFVKFDTPWQLCLTLWMKDKIQGDSLSWPNQLVYHLVFNFLNFWGKPSWHADMNLILLQYLAFFSSFHFQAILPTSLFIVALHVFSIVKKSCKSVRPNSSTFFIPRSLWRCIFDCLIFL